MAHMRHSQPDSGLYFQFNVLKRSKLFSLCSEAVGCVVWRLPRKVDVRLPEKGSKSSHGARPVRLIISMIEWIRTSWLSIKNSLSSPTQQATKGKQRQIYYHPLSKGTLMCPYGIAYRRAYAFMGSFLFKNSL